MPFEIDMVSEFTYFENLLLGLADALDKCIGVKQTHLKKFIPLPLVVINEWETAQGVLLPDDLESFYLASDGYNFEYTYSLESNNCATGRVNINSLENVVQVYGYETTNNPGVRYKGERYAIKLAPESKLFELCSLPSGEQVVLVYLYPTYVPTIWILCANKTLFYLANDIATYLKMAIVHLGIPNWQLRYTPKGVPYWTENIFRLLIPNLLTQPTVLEKMFKEKENVEIPVNILDPIIFDPNNYLEVDDVITVEVPVLEPEKLEKSVKFEKSRWVKPRKKTVKVKKKFAPESTLSLAASLNHQ